MRTKATFIAAIAILLGASAAVEAGTTSRHATRLSILLTELGTAQNGTTTLVGLTRGAPLGPGTIRVDAKVSASPFHYEMQLYSGAGTIKARGTAALTQRADGGRVLKGAGRITSGTGRFKGASSRRLQITGSQAPNDNIIQVKISGTARY